MREATPRHSMRVGVIKKKPLKENFAHLTRKQYAAAATPLTPPLGFTRKTQLLTDQPQQQRQQLANSAAKTTRENRRNDEET